MVEDKGGRLRASRSGGVVAVGVDGRLPTSGSTRDEDERLTLDGIRATRAVIRDIAGARPGSAVEREGLKLIDAIWDAHADAAALRRAAAEEFRSFAAQAGRAEVVVRPPRMLALQASSLIEAGKSGSISTSQQTTQPPLDIRKTSAAAPIVRDAIDGLLERGASTDVPATGGPQECPTVGAVDKLAGAGPPAATAAYDHAAPAVEIDTATLARWNAAVDLDALLTADSQFSACVESHIARRKASNPNLHVSSIIYPARLWIALVGDRPMNRYGPHELQRFVDAAKHVPPNFEKRWPNQPIASIVARNRDFSLGAPSRKTMSDAWIAGIKGVFSYHAKVARTRSPFQGETPDLPRILRAPRKHPAPPIEVTNAAFRLGASGDEIQALMPLLAYAVGRRIGLLAYLQGHSFRVDAATGIAYAKVGQSVTTRAGLALTPYKTDESITEFVVPRYVVDTGFLTWAMAKGDAFLFSGAHDCSDPADAVSKRINRLLEAARDSAGASEKGTAHGWRGQAEDRFDDNGVPDGASRIQVGHALEDVHSRYKSGRLPRPDARRIFEAPPDEGVDLTPFSNLDFTRFDRKE
jgi:hypothetical protein